VRTYPGFDQVAVLARDLGGHKALVAYAVVRTGQPRIDYDDFARFASQRLPEYMVPSTLLFVDFMPMGPSGKLDREALARLEAHRPDMEEPYLPPRSEREEQLAGLMAEILGIDRIGVNDNFFMLGGQSLLAARLIAKVAATFPEEAARLEAGVNENALLARFFREPTVASLEKALASAGPLTNSEAHSQGGTGAQPLRCIQEGEAGILPFFLLHGVLEGEAFYAWNLARGVGPEIPFYTIAPHGAHGAPVPESIEEMAQEYFALIRETQPQGPYRLGGYCNGGYVALEIARRLQAEGERVDCLLIVAASVRNVRFRRMEEWVQRIGRLSGLSPRKRRALFLALRGRVLSLEEGRNPCKRSQEERPIEQRMLKFLRVVDAYVPQPYSGHARVLWGAEDEASLANSPYNGWERVLDPLDYRQVAGGHLFLEDHPELVVEHLADLLKASAPIA
jgi:thioesterase domain-containing protein